MQRVDHLAAHLDGVLDAVELVGRDALVLRALRRELDVAAANFRVTKQPLRQLEVALLLELRQRELAIGGAGMARHEYRLAGGGSREVELEEVRRLRRLAVFVGAHHAHVETPARELEVVRVAAERGDAGFRREYDAHVGISLVLVEPVLPAFVKRDGLAFLRGLLLALAFELRERGLAHVVGSGLVLAGDGGRDLGGDFFHADEDVGHLCLAALFLFAGLRQEAFLDEALVLRRKLGEAGLDAMMVGEDQAFVGHETRRAAREAHGGGAHAVEPRLVEIGLQRGVDLGEWKAVEGPHAFVGTRAGTQEHHQCGAGPRRRIASWGNSVGRWADYHHNCRRAHGRIDASRVRFGARLLAHGMIGRRERPAQGRLLPRAAWAASRSHRVICPGTPSSIYMRRSPRSGCSPS